MQKFTLFTVLINHNSFKIFFYLFVWSIFAKFYYYYIIIIKLTLEAVAVNPALELPMPLVSTDLGMSLLVYLRNCDFPVPGSPASMRCDSPRTLVPDWSLLETPPAITKQTASFTIYIPYSFGHKLLNMMFLAIKGRDL